MSEFPNKFYVDQSGKYLGQFSGHIVEADEENPRRMIYAEPEDPNAIEVEFPPEDGRQIYDFGEKNWLPL